MYESRLLYRIAIVLMAGWLLILNTATLASQPTITIVPPFSMGGAADLMARAVQKILYRDMPGRKIIVENKPGASGEIGARYVANAKNSTTLLLASVSLATSNISNNDFYDINTDLIPVFYFGHIPLVLMTHTGSNIIDLRDISRSQKLLSYGSSGIATSSHLTGAALSKTLNTPMLHIPYKGVGQTVPDLISGVLDLTFMFYTTARPHIESNRLRPVAVAGSSRIPQMPMVPTFQELGHPNFGFNTWFLLMANPGADKNDIVEINRILKKALNNDQDTAAFRELGLDPDHQNFDNGRIMLDKEIKRYREFFNSHSINLQ